MKLRIGHRTYTVSPMEDAKAQRMKVAGLCSILNGTIEVSPTGSTCEQADTFLHEVLHAIYANAGLTDEDDEEKIVTMLASGLCQVIRDNPALIPTIAAGLDGAPIFPPKGA